MSFVQEIRQAEKEGVVGSGVWKPQEGANKIRIVAGPLRHEEEYEGKSRVKWLTLLIDRRDGTVHAYFMPHSIAKMIGELQQSDDYAFDRTPMPYDLTLSAKGAGTRDVEYGIVPAKKETPLTSEEMAAVAAFGELSDYQRRLRERKGESGEKARPFDPDEIPT